jgi:hypothetical protein
MVGEPGRVSARSDVAREGPDDQRFWARHVRISTVLYGLCCATILGYAAATGDEPYRAALALVVVVSMGAAILFDRALLLPRTSSAQVMRHARTRGECRRGGRVFVC